MLSLLLLGLRGFLGAYASPAEDEDDGIVEDEPTGRPMPGFPGGKMPSADELMKMLDSMSDLSAEDKEELRKNLLEQTQGRGAGPGGPGVEEHLVTSFFTSQLFILLAMLTIIVLIFVFFGYKLYKSLSERERKREEKKKNKQMKKKK